GFCTEKALAALDHTTLQCTRLLDEVFGEIARQCDTRLVLTGESAANQPRTASRQAEQAQIWRCAGQRLLLTTTGSCFLKEFCCLGEIVNRSGAFVRGLAETLSIRLAERVDFLTQFGN